MNGLLLGGYLLASTLGYHPMGNLPEAFDLRDVDGKSFVTAVKNQSGGTCWTHGTMAGIEGNLAMTGNWTKAGEDGEPALAEYHLDWWNGFNQHFNADIAPETGGLEVHEGGDYRVATAYLARGTGAVRKVDGQSFDSAPEEYNDSYHVYYVRDVDWLVKNVTDPEAQIARIKVALMTDGVVPTALAWSNRYYRSKDHTFYEDPSASSAPNHSVAIVGWDDTKETRADQPGAWLIKNSWGDKWGEHGFFWASYYDKYVGHHADMGAVSFHGAERMKYSHVYYHDYHGWRDTRADVSEAFNAYTAVGNGSGRETVKAVSFYTASDSVDYTVTIYGAFENGALSLPLSTQTGTAPITGFHTVDLKTPVPLKANDKFYVYVKLSKGGQAIDKTSDVPVLLGASYRTTVLSVGHPGDSFYRNASGEWVDVTNDDKSSKFCMKALSIFE